MHERPGSAGGRCCSRSSPCWPAAATTRDGHRDRPGRVESDDGLRHRVGDRHASPSDTADRVAESPRSRSAPTCGSEGAKLPGGYQDCYDGDHRVKADGRYCEFGKPLITYENSFWAVPGGAITEVEGKLATTRTTATRSKVRRLTASTLAPRLALRLVGSPIW